MTSKGSTSFVHYSWVILAFCFVDLFLNYGIRTGYGAILPEMIRAMGISRRQGADIINANVFAYICIAPFAGCLADRLGARVVIPTFGVLLGLGTFLMGTAADFPQAALFLPSRASEVRPCGRPYSPSCRHGLSLRKGA